jgi:hypothetical protein
MAPDAPGGARVSRGPRPFLLILLAVAAGVFLLIRLGGSSGQAPAAARGGTAATGAQQNAPADGTLDPSQLDVQLEALESERPAPGDAERDPFRFQPMPQPAPPPVRPNAAAATEAPSGPAGPAPPPPPPPAPPIPVKFIGTVDLPDGTKLATFTDCSLGRRNVFVREGQTILGQYRLVSIGVQSVVVEHLDGRGRTTLPKGGQECVK